MSTVNANKIIVFDIETIPDVEAAKNLLGIDPSDTNQAREALTNYHLDITDGKNPFLRQPFHKVVALSYTYATLEKADYSYYYNIKHIKSAGTASSDEMEIIAKFFDFINKETPSLVSFNGRTFDLPVLKYRAAKHGISAVGLYKTGDKWNNYHQRYSSDYHCDLIDVWSDYGASARIKMAEACSIFGFPGKHGVDGSCVSQYYDEGRIEDIRNYCESDTINTYLLFLRYKLLVGDLSIENYNLSIQSLLDYIKIAKLAHLDEFLEVWRKSCDGQFTL